MNLFEQHWATIADNGWPVVPVHHKVPSVWSGGQHWPMANWQRFADQLPNDIEIGIAGASPDMGVGIPCGGEIGRVCGFDIDIDDVEWSFEARQIAEQHLGETPFVRVGAAPKLLMVYRFASGEEMSAAKMKPIEILGRGNQFQALGTHPGGYPYRWIGEGGSPIDGDVSYAPALPRAAFLATAELIWSKLPAHLRPVQSLPSILPGDSATASAGLGAQASADAVFAALIAIPNIDLQRSEWVRVGMALKAALDPDHWAEGERAFGWWARQSPKCGASGKGDTPERTWRSFKPSGAIGAGTIFALAMAHGWQPPAELQFHEAEGVEIDIEKLMGGLKI